MLKYRSKPHKRIGVAVIYNQAGEILIDRRLPGGVMGGLWEFPGGKIEDNETIEACVKREVKEELGVDIRVREHLITLDYDYAQFTVTLNVYKCDLVAGKPQPLECAEVRWVNLEQISGFTFPEANYGIIDQLTK